MNIPEQAIEAAAKALAKGYDWENMDRSQFRHDARAALEAAAPVIVAEELREVADALKQPQTLWHGDSGVQVLVDQRTNRFLSLDAWLRGRADELEQS